MRLLDRLFDSAVASNKLPPLFSAVIDRLSRTDPKTAMVVIKTLLDEALERLPPEERDAHMRDFAELANPH
jgi:hypothetical protein